MGMCGIVGWRWWDGNGVRVGMGMGADWGGE